MGRIKLVRVFRASLSIAEQIHARRTVPLQLSRVDREGPKDTTLELESPMNFVSLVREAAACSADKKCLEIATCSISYNSIGWNRDVRDSESPSNKGIYA